MDDKKRKNSSITAWLEKRSKPNMNDPIPIAVNLLLHRYIQIKIHLQILLIKRTTTK